MAREWATYGREIWRLACNSTKKELQDHRKRIPKSVRSHQERERKSIHMIAYMERISLYDPITHDRRMPCTSMGMKIGDTIAKSGDETLWSHKYGVDTNFFQREAIYDHTLENGVLHNRMKPYKMPRSFQEVHKYRPYVMPYVMVRSFSEKKPRNPKTWPWNLKEALHDRTRWGWVLHEHENGKKNPYDCALQWREKWSPTIVHGMVFDAINQDLQCPKIDAKL